MSKKITVTPEMRNEMLSMRQERKTNQQIGDCFGVSSSWAGRKLREWGAPPAPGYHRVFLDDLTKEKIVDLYQSGLSVHDIGKEIGHTGDLVHKRLKKWGIPLRKNLFERQYKLNEDVFSQINEHSSYFAGLLMSDGYVYHPRNGQKIIGLCSKDKDVLYKFYGFLETERPIYDNKDGSFLASVSSDKIANDLKTRFGVVQRKSKTAKITDPLLLYNRHFWRGMVDGDGSVSDKRNAIFFCTASDRMADCYQELVDALEIKVANYLESTGLHNFYSGTTHAVKLAKFLYTNASVYMDRKMNGAQLMIQRG